jgi:DNA helicase II / ATP-dependent DNA helicase PcrA
MREVEEESTRQGKPAEGSLSSFLERCALVQAADTDTATDAVNLMTIHAAKGLEFDVVFLTGLEEGTLPLTRHGDAEPDNLEEERRLAYVAVTRARHQLHLSHCVTRRLFGNPMPRGPSRFLEELPTGLLRADASAFAVSWEPTAAPRPSGAARQRVARPTPGRPLERVSQEGGRVIDYEVPADGLRPTRPSRDDGELAILIGRTVRHRTFGVGQVRHAEYSDRRILLTIDFETVGTKKVVRSFVDLV